MMIRAASLLACATLLTACAGLGAKVHYPPAALCTDNGAMVAALGAEMVARGRVPGSLGLPADSSMPVTQVSA